MILLFTVVVKGFLSAVEFAVKSVQRRIIISDSEDNENDNNWKSMDKYIITINVLKSIVMICLKVIPKATSSEWKNQLSKGCIISSIKKFFIKVFLY